jgi:hypothetical protein
MSQDWQQGKSNIILDLGSKGDAAKSSEIRVAHFEPQSPSPSKKCHSQHQFVQSQKTIAFILLFRVFPWKKDIFFMILKLLLVRLGCTDSLTI